MKDVIVCGLAIIDRGDGNIVIGLKDKEDPFVKDLTWVFPGGRLKSMDFSNEIKDIVREKVNLEVEIKDIVHTRLIPDVHQDETRVVAMYFYCELKEGEGEARKGYSEIKWIPATDVFKYFTTSTASEIVEILKDITKAR